MDVVWSEANFMLLIIVIIYITYLVWYKYPFHQLDKVIRDIVEKDRNNKLIADTLVEAIIIGNDHGIIVDCNKTAETMFGYDVNTLRGLNVIALIPDGHRQDHIIGMARVARGGETRLLGKTVDTEGLKKDGTMFPVALSLTRTLTSNGTTYTAVVRDITERQAQEEEINQLNSALSTRLAASEAFNRSVTHDLNAPLRSIDGFSEILEQDYSDKLDKDGKDYIHRIRKSVAKMYQLIKDMMKLSTVTRPGIELIFTTISLTNLCKTAISDLQMAEPERKIEVKILDNMNIEADEELLPLAISALISNAWKYSSKNPNAAIEIGRNMINDEVVYFIKDNGVGFDQSRASELFQPFHRLHTQDEFEGSGIGLTIVKRVIELHKGRVWATGIVGVGATFYFTIGTSI
jgi:PAS domain S-box-containing protein